MLLTLPLLLAVASSPSLPAPEVLGRFPNASYWPGIGLQQVANMLADVRRDTELEMRSSGPGPQQLMARWERGGLGERDQLALLLGGASYHHPALLPAYAQALRSPSLTVRQAAAVGLAWLLGDRPPAPQSIPDSPDSWGRIAAFADQLVTATRTRTLVGLWVDSYLHARGLPRRPGLVLKREPGQCLQAIAEIATPADLPELLALWPLLTEPPERHAFLGVLEMVMVARLVARPSGERAGWGAWVYETGAEQVDAFVSRLCTTPAGWDLARRSALALSRLNDGCFGCTPGPWLRLLEMAYPPVWAVALEVLPAFGAPFAPFSRDEPEGLANARGVEVVLRHFEISANAPGGQIRRRVESLPGSLPGPRP